MYRCLTGNSSLSNLNQNEPSACSQQILNVTAAMSYESGKRRFPVARRLRAPLMGRSIVIESDNDIDITANHSDSNEIQHLDKRRYGLTLLGRRKWMSLKRKGPLFG